MHMLMLFAYCAIARGEMSSTNEEILELSEFLSHRLTFRFLIHFQVPTKNITLTNIINAIKLLTLFSEKRIFGIIKILQYLFIYQNLYSN